MKHVSVLLATLVLVLGTHTVTKGDPPVAVPPAPAAIQMWEYKSLPSTGSTGLDDVNAAGREGWRLVVKQDGWHVMERATR